MSTDQSFFLYPWQTASFSNAVGRTSTLPLAMLFCGPTHIGKTHLAYMFAVWYLCENKKIDGQPCQSCRACAWLSIGIHPNVRWVSGGDVQLGSVPLFELLRGQWQVNQSISIDQIRGIHSFLNLCSYAGQRKFVILSSMEDLTLSAAQALLKILEDSENVTFLLISSQPYSLLPTILSRCQEWLYCPLPGKDLVLSWLQSHFSMNGSAEWYLSGGRIFLAEHLCQLGGGASFFSWVQECLRPGVSCIETFEKFYTATEKLKGDPLFSLLLYLEGIQRLLVDVMREKSGIVNVTLAAEIPEVYQYLQSCSLQRLESIYSHIQHVCSYFAGNINRKIAIRNIMISLHGLLNSR